MNFPKRLFYKDCPECTFRHSVGYNTHDGYKMLFSMNYVNEFHKVIAERIVHLWNTAQPQKAEERAENSPASPVQHAQPAISLALAIQCVRDYWHEGVDSVVGAIEWEAKQQASAQ